MHNTKIINSTNFGLPYAYGYLDRITETELGYLVEGWAFEVKDGSTQFPTLLITSDWTEVVEVTSGNIERPDVKACFKNFDLDQLCGFSVVVPHNSVLVERGASAIQVFYKNNSEQAQVFQPLTRGFKKALQIELTGRCNLRCPMCPSVNWSDFHKKEIEQKNLPDLEKFFQDRDFICLDGFGESLLSKVFPDVLDLLPRASEAVFHTNGLLLDRKCDVILKNSPPISWIAISLDSLEPEKYARLRPGSTLSKVMDNIRIFKSRRDSLGQLYPRIRLNLTIMKDNFEELENFVKAAVEFDSIVECNWLYDADHLDGSIHVEVGGETFDYETQKPKHYAKEVNERIRVAKNLADTLGVEMIFNSYLNEMLTESPDENDFSGSTHREIADCPHLKGDFMVEADGKVKSCVWQTAPYMDWREAGINSIKNSPRLKVIQELAAQGRVPKECSGAGCSYVRKYISEEEGKENVLIGGYSGAKVSTRKPIKIRVARK